MSKQKLEENQDLIINNRLALYNHMVLTDLEEESTGGYLSIESDVMSAYGMVYGGILYVLADVVAGMTARGSGHIYVTQTADLHYLVSIAEKRIYGYSYVLRRGSKTAVIVVKVIDSKGEKLLLVTFAFYCVDGRVAMRREENRRADS